MAKERMVTRTVTTNIFEVMTCNVETAEARVIEFKIGPIPANSDALKELKKVYETENLKLCAIVGHNEETVLYGMPESFFIEHATVLPNKVKAE